AGRRRGRPRRTGGGTVQRTVIGEDRRQRSLRRFAPGWMEKTIAQFLCLLFRGQRLERTEDRGVCGALRRGGWEKPSLSFSVFCSEDSDWRGQKTEEFAALRAGWVGKTIARFLCLLFRGQ
ncbi:MAG: hypothetical protein LBD06_03030, partial [Candidatus Accumulibacter sp.]|nr:hypothetical protein [Accumulibacter sp.]